MMQFSERMGLIAVRSTFQIDSIDTELKNGIWNVINAQLIDKFSTNPITSKQHISWFRRIWDEFLKLPYDDLPSSFFEKRLKLGEFFYRLDWYRIYDFAEFCAESGPSRGDRERIREAFNGVFKREMSGYRFVGSTISRVTSEEEIASLEAAQQLGCRYRAVETHMQTAVSLMSNRQNPDYRNSIKEAISAVESMCKIVTGDNKATLGQALKKLDGAGITIHKALIGAFLQLYGYTNDADGIRHALMDESDLEIDDAKFMVVTCSAFVNYLKEKSA